MDVVVVGSCNMDLISYVPRLPKPGETLHGHKFSIGFGGKGANQCIMASRMGAKVAMVAKVGKDTFGKDYIENFKENKINIEHVRQTDQASTGVAPIAVNEDGQNAIIIVSGANLLVNESDIQKAEDMISKSKVVVCQLEITLEATIEALRIARKHGVKTIFNPAPGRSDLDPSIFSFCDIIAPNESEAEILTGLPVKTVEDAGAAIEALLDKGCKTVIITMGEKGVVYADRDNRLPVHLPVSKVTPVDTTGAGDAFMGALAYFLALHPSMVLSEAIRRSSQVATISVQAPGTQSSYPWRKDLPAELFT